MHKEKGHAALREHIDVGKEEFDVHKEKYENLSACVKLPAKIKTTEKRSDNEVSSTTDSSSKRNTRITVQSSNNENGRKWDKVQFCLFCEKGYTNIRKHYLKTHKTETEVQKVLGMPLKSNERATELTRLRNAGNYKHNVSVLKENRGEFVVVSSQSYESEPTDYLPCDDCLGFFLKESLWRHKHVCPFRTGIQKSRRVQADAALLLPASKEIHQGLKENVFGKMIRDEVTIAARNDRIILKVGGKLYQKHGHLKHLYTHISQTRGPRGPWVAHLRKWSKVTVEPIIEYPRGII